MIGAAGTALNETERKMRFAKGAERERKRALFHSAWLAGWLPICLPGRRQFACSLAAAAAAY